MAVPAPVDRDTFVDYLRQSSLLSDEQLARVREQTPENTRGRAIARALVEHGWLTKFQAQRLLAGRTNGFLLGQYRILDQIGRGGMGQVFKAIHKTMNREVALKVLAPNLVNTVKAQQLFLREMQAAARLLHPNIVTAYDANQVGNRYFLVMEYVDGPNLDQFVREQGPLPLGQACDFIHQAALGLQHALEMGMVHRDIKPSNLLIHRPVTNSADKRCIIKILDFGLARLGEPGENEPRHAGTIIAQHNTLMGTPDYVSPEQARDMHEADIRSDLYSLGCTFYYLLVGRVPFPGGKAMDKLVRHSTEEPASIDQVRSDVPPGVTAIVRKLMAKEPDARYQTPAELAAALAPYAVALGAPWTMPDLDIGLDVTPWLADSGFLPNASNFDDMLAQVSTLPPEVSPTPLCPSPVVTLCQPHAPAEEADKRRLRLAVGIATGIVVGVVGLAALIFGR